jgi:hypothetical protein
MLWISLASRYKERVEPAAFVNISIGNLFQQVFPFTRHATKPIIYILKGCQIPIIVNSPASPTRENKGPDFILNVKGFADNKFGRL